jgi:2-keto-3-deoxy-L-rhamnonate aldolase RhmA
MAHPPPEDLAMNPFCHLLRAAGHHPPIGTWINSASPIVAEAMGHAGFDWGVIDLGHTSLDMMDVVHMLQAVAATKMVPVVRVPWHDGSVVQRVLDAGAQTLLFPSVHGPSEAKQALAATRYPPEGTRGVSVMSRASRFGTVPQYLKHAGEGTGVVVQLETPAALDAVEAIAAVDGVDALFIAPVALAAHLGHLGEPHHHEVVMCMARAAHRARAIGMPVGTVGATPEVVTQYRAAGFDFVAVGSDLELLMRGALGAVSALRTQEGGAHVHSLSAGTRTD